MLSIVAFYGQLRRLVKPDDGDHLKTLDLSQCTTR
jgi:hypothetical protein